MSRTLTRMTVGLAAVATATAAVLSACSSATDSKSDSAASSASATAQQETAHNSDDVMFARMMIPHHEQAVELAAMVPQHTTNPDMIALAAEILKAQQPEINVMKTQLAQWGVTSDESSEHDAHMSGMVDSATMAKLKTLQGADFDKLWLESMIDHHKGAIEMAQNEVANGQNPDMIALAGNIVAAQQAEIDKMKTMLAAAGG